ncbi:MAG: hypothetical protein ACYDCN_01055 [Bacteroidia bacterium]
MTKPTEIDMGFRTITLAYKNQAELSLYELKLIDKYKQIHTNHKLFMDAMNLFTKNLSQLKGYVKEGKRTVQQLKLKWNHIMELDTLYAQAKKDSKEYNKVHKLLKEFDKQTKLLHDLNKRDKTLYDIIDMQWTGTDNASDVFNSLTKEFNEFVKEFSQHPEKYDLDSQSLYNDLVLFNTAAKKDVAAWVKQKDEATDLIDNGYNAIPKLSEQLNTSIANYKSNHFQMYNPNAVPAATKTDPQVKSLKKYLFNKEHELFAPHAKELEVAAVIQKGLQMPIPWAMVEAKDVMKPINMICAAQHKTEWINNLIFGINLTFDDMPVTEPMLSHQHIMSNPKILAWMAKFAENPLWLFFIQSEAIRSGALYADLILMQQADVRNRPEEERDMIGFKPEHLQIINDRLYNACIMFVEYCYATSIDTRAHINHLLQTSILSQLVTEEGESVIKQLFTYEDVLTEWKKGFKH